MFGLCRIAHLHSQVEAEDKITEIETESHAGSQGHLFVKPGQMKLGTWAVILFVDGPHVAGIEEEGPFEKADQMEPVFQVGLQFDVARLVGIGTLGCPVSAGAQGTYLPGPDLVGSARKILFFKG